VQLVVQALLGDLVLGDQAAAVPHRGGQRILQLIGHETALALAGQVGQCGAVAVVGLEPPRAQLGAGGGGLRGCEQSHRAGKALVELANPGLMQPTGRLDGEDRSARPDVVGDQPLQSIQAGAENWQRHRWHHFAGLAGAHPDPIADLARVDRHHQRRCRQRLVQQAHNSLPFLRKRHQDASAGTGSTAIS
jgi:hypothetical protein